MGDCLMCGQPLAKHSHKGECNAFIGADDVVGHKTFDTGERDEHGLPKLRHEPLTRAEGEALWASEQAAKAKRAEAMPDEQAAISAMFSAWLRLKELGWREAMYAPKGGKHFKVIENGSTGIFDCAYIGDWPSGHWHTFDEDDCYPSSISPAMFRLYPDDEAKEKERMEAAKARYQTTREDLDRDSPMSYPRNGVGG